MLEKTADLSIWWQNYKKNEAHACQWVSNFVVVSAELFVYKMAPRLLEIHFLLAAL